MSNNPEEYVEWEVPSWREAIEIAGLMPSWIFRGHERYDWDLATNLERLAKQHNHPLDGLRDTERYILNLFKRQGHHYISAPPEAKEDLEWLSILQHHGGPTRLLDFTQSFYVAVFFALENAQEHAVVWALDAYQINRTLLSTMVQKGKKSEDLSRELVEKNLSGESMREGVVAVRPWRLNQRMIIQQGWFLCPLGIDLTFELNLCRTLGLPGAKLPLKPTVDKKELLKKLHQPNSPIKMLKFIFYKNLHLEALDDLRRMNITAASLFPGLDGFARSLKFPLRIFDDLN